MQTRIFDITQPEGWVAATDGATQVLVQLRTHGNVELVVSKLTPADAPVQGILLTSTAFPVFSATGLDEDDIVFFRIVGEATDTDTLAVIDNGAAPVGPA